MNIAFSEVTFALIINYDTRKDTSNDVFHESHIMTEIAVYLLNSYNVFPFLFVTMSAQYKSVREVSSQKYFTLQTIIFTCFG